MKNLDSSTKRFLTYMTTSIIVLVSIIGIQIVLSLFTQKYDVKFDVTEGKMHTISDTTKEFLRNLDKEVSIKFLNKDRYDFFSEQIREYKKYSDKISIEFLDLDSNPTLAQQYMTGNNPLNYGSIIVQYSTGDNMKFKILNQEEFYERSEEGKEQFIQEEKFMGAINYVVSDDDITIYSITGHEENKFNELVGLDEYAKKQFFVNKEHNLLRDGNIPEEATIVAIINPKVDYAEIEIEYLESFLNNGGKLIVFADYGVKYTNLNKLFNKFGININNDIVIEVDPNYAANQSPVLPIPKILPSDISQEFEADSQKFVVMQQARSISVIDTEGVNIIPLLQTSEKSWGETNFTVNPSKDDNDNAGPLYLGVHVKKIIDESKVTQIYVFGDLEFVFLQGASNQLFVQNAMNTLFERKNNLVIEGKELADKAFFIKSSTSAYIILAIAILIPLVFIVLGIVVWLRRRSL